MPSEENIMSINKIIGVKREREREREKKGHHSGKGTIVGALSTVCMSLTMHERGRSRFLYNVAKQSVYQGQFFSLLDAWQRRVSQSLKPRFG